MEYFLAIDIGASNGRHIIGYKENGKLITHEIFRFSNEISYLDGHYTWDIDALFLNVKKGIKKSLEKYPLIKSMSIDTWGVDYVLMKEDKEIYPCYSYRDKRTKEVIEEVHKLISFDELYSITGTQFQEFNTIYQLYWDKLHGRLDDVTDYLMIPEYLIYRLTNVKVKEYTNASTTALMDIKKGKFSVDLITRLSLPEELFGKISKPKLNVGYFTKEVEEEVGGNIKVVLCSTHDTASAVEGITMDINSPYISSGTWSLFGIKIKDPITSSISLESNFSNECGPDYIRFQKNIMGLWIIQCLAKEMNMSYNEMVSLASSSLYKEIYDVNDERFLKPSNMKEQIIQYFKDKDITLPITDADIINSTFLSLAYSYKIAIDELELITKKSYPKLYIVGGGAKNTLLNKYTSDITKKEIIALPIEATAIGNLKIQMEK